MNGDQQSQPPDPPALDPNPLPGRIDPDPSGRPDRPPVAQRSLYARPQPFADADSWGKPNAFINAAAMSPRIEGSLNMPSAPEAYSYAASSTGQLARWSAPDVAAPAARANQAALSFAPLIDILSKGVFSKAFNASSLAAIKRRQAQMMMDLEETRRAHESMMLDFAQIYNAYDSIDAKTGEHGISQHEAEQRLLDLARMYRWDPMENLIGTHGLEASRQFLKKEHATYLELAASQTTLKKATGSDEDAEIAEEWGLDPNDITRGGTGVTGGGGFFAGSPTPSAPDESKTPQRPDFSREFDANYGRKMGLSPQQMKSIQEEVETGKPPSSISMLEKQKGGQAKEIALGRQGQAVVDLNNRIDRIAADPNLSYDDKMKQIEQINPGVANHIKGLLNLDRDPKEPTVPNRALMSDRAEAISQSKGSPGQFKQSNFANAKKFSDTSSVENKVVTRANDLVQNWMTLLQSLKAIGENKSIPDEVIESWINGHFTGDPEYDQVYSQIRNIVTQINSIQTLTGSPRVTLVHDMVTNLRKDSSPRSIRAQLLPDIQDAYAIINSYQDQFEGLGMKKLMPGISASNFKDYRAIVRMNPYTAAVPEDSSLELKAAGSDPNKASTRLKDEQKMPPLTLDQIRQLKAKIAVMENSSDPAVRQKAQDYRERIGPVKNIDRRIPGVDEDSNARP